MFFMHCYIVYCLFCISLLDKGGCFRQSFFIWDPKKWLLAVLDRWLSYTVTIAWEFAWADSALVVLDEWLPYRGGCLNRFDYNTSKLIQNNFVCLMEKQVHVFICIISQGSAKSLVPPLCKFTIWHLDLIFFPF